MPRSAQNRSRRIPSRAEICYLCLMQQYVTLSQLQKMVKTTLNQAFALPLWVSAEIAEIKVNYSGHCYLELVEKGGENGVPLSQARAVTSPMASMPASPTYSSPVCLISRSSPERSQR